MSLVPWRRPTSPAMTSLQTEMNRLFEDFFSGERSLSRDFWGSGSEHLLPAVDIHETEDKLVVEAELPGLDPKEVQIRLEGNVLWITGERKRAHEEKTKSYHRVERSYGRFERQLSLPAGCDPDRIDATYRNGVLTIEVAKKEEAKPRSIQVKVRS